MNGYADLYKLFKNETLWETFMGSNGVPQYAVTSDKRRDNYYLWVFKKSGKGLVADKIARAKNPTDLRKKMKWR